MAAGLAPPRRVMSHGWWTIEGEKMSKSLGNAIEARSLAATYGLDPLRYFLLRELPFGSDGDLNRRALVTRLNVELANDLGNLAQRSLVADRTQLRRPVAGEGTSDRGRPGAARARRRLCRRCCASGWTAKPSTTRSRKSGK